MYRVLNGIGLALIILVMVVGVATYAAPYFGWRVEGLRSSSMAPELERGALVIASPVKPETIMVNDIIIFRPVAVGETLVSHRVIAISHNSPYQFRTKGDAAIISDPDWVPSENVVGRVRFYVPLLGYGVLFLKTPLGFMVAVVIPAGFITLMCLKDIWLELIKKRKQNN